MLRQTDNISVRIGLTHFALVRRTVKTDTRSRDEDPRSGTFRSEWHLSSFSYELYIYNVIAVKHVAWVTHNYLRQNWRQLISTCPTNTGELIRWAYAQSASGVFAVTVTHEH